MIVMLDTNVLVADLNFRDALWRLVGARPESWGLSVMLPWAVQEELAAHRRRELEKYLQTLITHIDDAPRKFGLTLSRPKALGQIRDACAAVDADLANLLSQLRVQIEPIPQIAHEELVKRAVARTRPCDDKGDGFRDTLNWFTVLAVAGRNPGEKILWVSNDKDFAETSGTSPRSLHPDLLADIRARVPDVEITLVTSLNEARAAIVAAHQASTEPSEYLSERLAELLPQAVVASASARELDVVACGLPMSLRTAHGVLVAITRLDDVTVTPLNDSTALPFTAKVTATVRMAKYSGADGSVTIDSSGDSDVEKELVIQGAARYDPTNHVVDASSLDIDSIAAAAGDPQVLLNEEARAKMAVNVRALAEILTQVQGFDMPDVALGASISQAIRQQLAVPRINASDLTGFSSTGHALQDAARLTGAGLRLDLPNIPVIGQAYGDSAAKATGWVGDLHSQLSGLLGPLRMPHTPGVESPGEDGEEEESSGLED